MGRTRPLFHLFFYLFLQHSITTRPVLDVGVEKFTNVGSQEGFESNQV